MRCCCRGFDGVDRWGAGPEQVGAGICVRVQPEIPADRFDAAHFSLFVFDSFDPLPWRC